MRYLLIAYEEKPGPVITDSWAIINKCQDAIKEEYKILGSGTYSNPSAVKESSFLTEIFFEETSKAI